MSEHPKKNCFVIGSPISHSFSPLVHNVALDALGLSESFSYSSLEVKKEDLEKTIADMRANNIYELSCTLPHKEAVVPFLDCVEGVAKAIGAVNTVINKNGELVGYNTDLAGVVEPFKKRLTLKGKKVLLLGAGGAAKAAAFGFVEEGCHLTITNRTFEKAEKLASETNAETLPWECREEEAKNFEIIFNATSLGFIESEFSPLTSTAFTKNQIVCDAIYNPYDTQFLKNASLAGCEIIHGTEMFIEQAAQQILLYAGVEAPRKIMMDALMEKLCQR